MRKKRKEKWSIPTYKFKPSRTPYCTWMLWCRVGKPPSFVPRLTMTPCFAQKPICCWCSVCSTVLCSPPAQAVAVGFSSSLPKPHLLSAANKLQLWMTLKKNRRHAVSDLADGRICFVTFAFCLPAYWNSSVYKHPLTKLPQILAPPTSCVAFSTSCHLGKALLITSGE